MLEPHELGQERIEGAEERRSGGAEERRAVSFLSLGRKIKEFVVDRTSNTFRNNFYCFR